LPRQIIIRRSFLLERGVAFKPLPEGLEGCTAVEAATDGLLHRMGFIKSKQYADNSTQMMHLGRPCVDGAAAVLIVKKKIFIKERSSWNYSRIYSLEPGGFYISRMDF
jgi:hypothetical protein